MENKMIAPENELNNLEKLKSFSQIELCEKLLENQRELDQKDIQIEELEATIQRLRELLKLSQSNAYGTSSEKNLDPNIEQLSMLDEEPRGVFNEAERYVEVEKKTHVRRKEGKVGPNKPCFDHLPVVEVIEEPSDADMHCECGGTRRVLKTVERFEIGIVPAKLYKIKYVSQELSCPTCDKAGDQPIINSARQLPVFSGSYASSSLLAYIMAKKYWEKVPVHRLEKQFWYSGIQMSRSLLSRWLIDGAHLYLRGLYDLLHENLLQCSIIGADETKLQVLREPGRKASQSSYMWHYVSGHQESRQIALYQYQPGRSGEYARRFLEGFSGFLLTDGYSGYNKVQGVSRAGCHAHARRKFADAIKAMGADKAGARATLAYQGLQYYDELFRLERLFSTMSREERFQARLTQSKPLLEALKTWLHSTGKVVVAKSKLGEAVQYSLNQWPNLITFLQDPDLEISNNRAERGIKEFVIGRKNFLFSTSAGGAQASEMVYSIVETAKANRLHPYEYLKHIIDELSQNRQTREKLEELLPWSDKLPDHVRIPNDHIENT